MTYKEIEQEQTDQAGEPTIAAQQQQRQWGSVPVDDTEADGDDNPWLNDDFDPGVGPYTLEELYARIDEAEANVAAGMWLTEEESRNRIRQKFPWL